MLGGHCIKTSSPTQGAVALSSAEAEFYAMVEGALRAKWATTVAKEMGVRGVEGALVLGTDSAAAKSFVARRGLGRMRHLEVRDLWLQREVAQGKIAVVKEKGEENPADTGTKYLHAGQLAERLGRMNLRAAGSGEGAC